MNQNKKEFNKVINGGFQLASLGQSTDRFDH